MRPLPCWMLPTLLALLLAACTRATPDPGLTVAAAASLRFAFSEIGERFQDESGVPVTFVWGSTSRLTRQVENGAPFDIFAAADVVHVYQLAGQDLILPDSQRVYARGRIVLAVNRESGLSVASLADLAGPAIPRLAIANPALAPYGLAAQQALQSAGVWEAVIPKLVMGENVRQTLQFVQTGDAPAGIVALSVADVPEVSYTLIPDDLHQPIDHALAILASSPHQAEAWGFLALLESPAGREIMARHGFAHPEG